ncbi:MAG: glycerophosphodiester phosphodiesterase family protein [Chlamydiota bacterium]
MKSILCGTLLLFNNVQALQVQGHRGARALMPENTLPSFDAAIKARAHVLELDLLLTSDEECVIHHDYFINKELCTYLDGSLIEIPPLIKQLTLAEIREIDAGGQVNQKFPKQAFIPKTAIPTLIELFEWINNSSHSQAKTIRLNLEIKRDPRFPEWTGTPDLIAEKIVNLVDQNGFSNRVYYSSFDPDALLAIRNKSPNAHLGLIFNEKSLLIADPLDPKNGLDLLLQLASSLQVEILSPDHKLLGNLINVSFLQEKGFQVIPWTVNESERWKELTRMNVDGIITDDPEELINWLENTDIRTQEIL